MIAATNHAARESQPLGAVHAQEAPYVQHIGHILCLSVTIHLETTPDPVYGMSG